MNLLFETELNSIIKLKTYQLSFKAKHNGTTKTLKLKSELHLTENLKSLATKFSNQCEHKIFINQSQLPPTHPNLLTSNPDILAVKNYSRIWGNLGCEAHQKPNGIKLFVSE